MNVLNVYLLSQGAKLVKKSKRFLFAYHFFAINYENVYDNFPFLTFYLPNTIFHLLFTANFVIYT